MNLLGNHWPPAPRSPSQEGNPPPMISTKKDSYYYRWWTEGEPRQSLLTHSVPSLLMVIDGHEGSTASPVLRVSSPGGLVPRAGKKGECWTFLDWRLNSENDSPVHGQPARFGHTGRKLISCGAGLDWEAFYISISFLVVETGSAHLRRVNHCRSVRISFISSEAKHEPPYVTEERQWGTNRNWNFIIIICPKKFQFQFYYLYYYYFFLVFFL